ncbi:MAG: tRNA (adenosine(37)-N6)-dimethylallyltransferase MiaA [Anaerolineae bacterium]|jgi:tRNA dimethylallyltransferase|nr:MAG: tRNA (adenosine(37)-N6)-dimethylallyltransferase MiaA [Anaerolineae bacterium]
MDTDSNRKIVMMIGPTGVGKTECAYFLAKALDGEIVSIDSRYLYRGMDIGTAKPSLKMRETVRHHLVDVADPDEDWSLAVFLEKVYESLEEIFSRGKLPIFVGGTGQYYRAILEGWQPPPVAPNAQLRAILERWLRPLQPHERLCNLRKLDPEAASVIDPRNLRRMVRAFEVTLLTGIPFSKQRKGAPIPYRTFIVGLSLPRNELYERCDQRIDRMFQEGWVNEVKTLLNQGYSSDLPSFSAIGYREIAAYLQGLISMDEVITQIRRRTRTLIRRQANWFRPNDPQIHWFVASETAYREIQQTVEQWLAHPCPLNET